MPLDINNIYVLSEAIKQLPPEITFLSDRYAPTNAASDIFATEQIIIDVMDGDRIAAPFVVPSVGGVRVGRTGFKTEAYKPGTIDVHTPLTYDDLIRRTFGEQFNTVMTPEQRQDAFIMSDLDNLKRAIRNRRELMVGEVLTSNALNMIHTDNTGKFQKEETLLYYEDEDNKSLYTVSTEWDDASASIFNDLKAMVRQMRAKGVAVTDLICGPEVADAITANEEIQKILDNRRYNLGEVTQSVEANGVSIVCKLVVDGTLLTVYCYDATFIDLTDQTEKRAIPYGYVVLTAPNSCKTKFGAITLLEEDKMFHTYAEAYVPHVEIDMHSQNRTLHVQSNPLVHPAGIMTFMYSQVMTEETE